MAGATILNSADKHFHHLRKVLLDSTGLDFIAKSYLCPFVTNLSPYPALNSQPYCGTLEDHQSSKLTALSMSVFFPNLNNLVQWYMKGDETREAEAWGEQSQSLVLGPGGFILRAIDIETLGHSSH